MEHQEINKLEEEEVNKVVSSETREDVITDIQRDLDAIEKLKQEKQQFIRTEGKRMAEMVKNTALHIKSECIERISKIDEACSNGEISKEQMVAVEANQRIISEVDNIFKHDALFVKSKLEAVPFEFSQDICFIRNHIKNARHRLRTAKLNFDDDQFDKLMSALSNSSTEEASALKTFLFYFFRQISKEKDYAKQHELYIRFSLTFILSAVSLNTVPMSTRYFSFRMYPEKFESISEEFIESGMILTEDWLPKEENSVHPKLAIEVQSENK